MSSGASCRQIKMNKKAIEKLNKNICNFKRYKKGCGIRQLGTTSKPIEDIVMASTVTYLNDLVFVDSDGNTTLTLGTGTITGNITGTISGPLNGSVNASDPTNSIILPNGNTVIGTATTGSIIFDTLDQRLKYYNGNIWVTISNDP